MLWNNQQDAMIGITEQPNLQREVKKGLPEEVELGKGQPYKEPAAGAKALR